MYKRKFEKERNLCYNKVKEGKGGIFMKKGNIVKVIVLIIILLLLVVLLYFMRNVSIIQKLTNAYHDFFSSPNYSYIAYFDSDQVVEYFYKDGKYIERWKNKEKIVREIWADEVSKEKIEIFPDSNIAHTGKIEEKETQPIDSVSSLVSDNWKKKKKNSFSYTITTEEVNGKECYKLQPSRGVVSNTYYFDKETGKLARCIIGENSIDFTEWKLNEVTEEMVARPLLEKYEVKEN